MEKRTIKIKTDEQASLITVETSATTLGELKKEVSINWDNTSVVVKDTKISLPFNDSVLPSGNTLLFVFPQKSKSGAYSHKEAKAKIKALKKDGVVIPFNYTIVSTEVLNKFLEAYESLEDECNKASEVETIKLEAGKKYLLIVEGNMTKEVIVERIPEGYVSTKILVDTTTIAELDAEYSAMRKRM
jgi:hypothetical protein